MQRFRSSRRECLARAWYVETVRLDCGSRREEYSDVQDGGDLGIEEGVSLTLALQFQPQLPTLARARSTFSSNLIFLSASVPALE